MVMSLLSTVGTHCLVATVVFAVAILLTVKALPGIRYVDTNIQAFPAKVDVRWTIRSVEGKN